LSHQFGGGNRRIRLSKVRRVEAAANAEEPERLSASLLTIACDESGSEGENIMGSRDPLFVHASTSVGLDFAEELLADFRASTRSQAPEIKSKTALRAANRPALLRMLAAVGSSGNIYLLEKQFFMAAKLVNTLIAEPAAELGMDVAGAGQGRQFASMLHERAPQALGDESWRALLESFNDLIRLHARKGDSPPAPHVFLDHLRSARGRCDDRVVGEILEWIWQFRDHVSNYSDTDQRSRFREFDPMFGTLTSIAMTWTVRVGDVPMEFLVDEYSTLDATTITMIKQAVSEPLNLRGEALPRSNLRDIRSIDSRHDARVQVADVLAGVGQEIARMAYAGVLDDDLQNATREMLDGNGMWADDSALDLLWESNVPEYFKAWRARHSP